MLSLFYRQSILKDLKKKKKKKIYIYIYIYIIVIVFIIVYYLLPLFHQFEYSHHLNYLCGINHEYP